MTAITLTAPTNDQVADDAYAPARITQLTVPTPPARRTHQAGFRYATVQLSGRLSIAEASTGGALFPLGRRTASGTAYRVALGEGITCWLDGDHLGRDINPVATQVCLELSDDIFGGPDDAPFVCGPVLFTGGPTGTPAGLSDRQLRLIVDAHATASLGELADLDLADLDLADLGLADAVGLI